jgi:hypothetical protein
MIDGYHGALGRETLGNRTAYTTRTAGYQRKTAVKSGR